MTPAPDKFINVAVIGVGAFGRNHARIYHQLAQQGEAVRLVGSGGSGPDAGRRCRP